MWAEGRVQVLMDSRACTNVLGDAGPQSEGTDMDPHPLHSGGLGVSQCRIMFYRLILVSELGSREIVDLVKRNGASFGERRQSQVLPRGKVRCLEGED